MAGQLTPGRIADGFTLIELLVVIAVLSVLTVGAALLVPRRAGAPDSDLAVFRAGHDRMRSIAIHAQTPRGIFVTPRGWRLAERRGGEWQSAGPELVWRAPVRIERERVAGGGGSAARSPQIVFLPDGQTTVFTARFGIGRDEVRCASDGWTGLTCGGR